MPGSGTKPNKKAAAPPVPIRVGPWGRFRRLFTKTNLPGWLAFLILVFHDIPVFKGRIDVWADAARAGGGYTPALSTVVTSQYFSFGLSVFCIAWFAFAGEPRNWVQRHPALAVIGWAMVLSFLAALLFVIGAGFFQLKVMEEAS